MTKKGKTTKRGARKVGYVPVSKRMLKRYYMVRLDLARKEVADGASLSLSTLDRIFRKGKATVHSAGNLLQFFQERVRSWNAIVMKENEKKDDAVKEDLIPMLTSLSEWPKGCRVGGPLAIVVGEAAAVAGGKMGETRESTIGVCPALGVLDRRIRELMKTSMAGEENRWGRVFVIRVAPDRPVCVEQVRDRTDHNERDVEFEESLKRRVVDGLAAQKSPGKVPRRRPIREFIARESTEGWVRIIEVLGESIGARRTASDLLDPGWERRLFFSPFMRFDDFEEWDRRRRKLMEKDEMWLANRDKVGRNCDEELRIWGQCHAEPLE